MSNKLMFRILGAIASSLIIVSVFIPFVDTAKYTQSLWEAYKVSNNLYLPIMIISFGSIGVFFFSINIKTEFAYSTSGAITFYLITETITIINKNMFNVLGVGYYCLVTGTILTALMAFICNLKSKKSMKLKSIKTENEISVLEQIDKLYANQNTFVPEQKNNMFNNFVSNDYTSSQLIQNQQLEVNSFNNQNTNIFNEMPAVTQEPQANVFGLEATPAVQQISAMPAVEQEPQANVFGLEATPAVQQISAMPAVTQEAQANVFGLEATPAVQQIPAMPAVTQEPQTNVFGLEATPAVQQIPAMPAVTQEPQANVFGLEATPAVQQIPAMPAVTQEPQTNVFGLEATPAVQQIPAMPAVEQEPQTNVFGLEATPAVQQIPAMPAVAQEPQANVFGLEATPAVQQIPAMPAVVQEPVIKKTESEIVLEQSTMPVMAPAKSESSTIQIAQPVILNTSQAPQIQQSTSQSVLSQQNPVIQSFNVEKPKKDDMLTANTTFVQTNNNFQSQAVDASSNLDIFN